MGRLIVIEGLDGSGKQTQARLLADGLRSQGLVVGKLSFPSYGQPSAAAVEEYLCGAYGGTPDDVGPYGASLLFAADRFGSYMKSWRHLLEESDVVVCDRYVGSNAIHQCSKLPQDEWAGFVSWLMDLEFEKVGLPKPDMTLYLRVGVDGSQRMLSGRYGGHEERKDIHESDKGYMARSRLAAEWCASHLFWTPIECEENGSMRSIQSIHNEIMRRCGVTE